MRLPTCNHLFAYGTLRRGSKYPMSRLLNKHADFVDHATYQGKLYLVDYYPGAVPSAQPEDLIQGEVYRLHSPSLLLPQLDKYEGCSFNSAQSNNCEYVRKIQSVKLQHAALISAWVYLYNKPTAKLTKVPSGDFLKVCKIHPRESIYSP